MTSSEPNYTRPDLALLGEDHIRAYRDTGGEVGYLWNGVPTLLLTATGRRTGRELTSALIFARDGGDYLIVASMGGAPKHPMWYLNLQAKPASQDSGEGRRTRRRRAHRIGGREAPAMEDRHRGLAQLRRL